MDTERGSKFWDPTEGSKEKYQWPPDTKNGKTGMELRINLLNTKNLLKEVGVLGSSL